MKLTYLHVALIFWLAVFLLWAAIAHACDAMPCREEVTVRATVVETCDPARPQATQCENIIVMPLTEEDLQAQPPAQDVIDAWRLNGIEPAVGVME